VSLLPVFPTTRSAEYGVAFNYRYYKPEVTWHGDEVTDLVGAAVVLGIELLQFLGSKYRDDDGNREQLD
jgi:hypothetical protein